MTKVDWSNYNYIQLKEVCSIERAIKGKIYPKGSTLIQLSGMVSTEPLFLKDDKEVAVKYAVITPKQGNNKRYIHEVIKDNWEEFKTKYTTTINLQFGALNYFKIPVHPKEIQDHAARLFESIDKRMEEQIKKIEHATNLKKWMLENSFV